MKFYFSIVRVASFSNERQLGLMFTKDKSSYNRNINLRLCLWLLDLEIGVCEK